MTNFDRAISFSFLAYILLLLLAFLCGFKEAIPSYMYVMQVVIALSFFSMLYFCMRLESAQSVLYVNLAVFLIITFALRYVFLSYTGHPYNHFKSVDVYVYERNATKYMDADYISFLSSAKYSAGRLNIDDVGYSSIVWFIQTIFHDMDYVRMVLLFLNALALTISLKYIYLICRLVGIDERISIATISFYGLFPFLAVNATMGLKENIFCMLIVCAFYYMYQFREYRSRRAFLLSMLFVWSTFLFRTAITLMLLLLYIPLLYCNESNRRKSVYWGVIGGGIIAVILPFLIANFTETTMDHVIRVAEARNLKSGRGAHSGTYMWLVQVISSFLGPFPNFSRMVQYGILHNSGLFLKAILTFFTIIGIRNVIKKFDYRLYPIVIYLFMGYTMLALSGVALDMRYHVTFFVAFVILMAKGIQEYKGRESWFYAYAFGSILLIALYNMR